MNVAHIGVTFAASETESLRFILELISYNTVCSLNQILNLLSTIYM